jgi:hypothetical protein
VKRQFDESKHKRGAGGKFMATGRGRNDVTSKPKTQEQAKADIKKSLGQGMGGKKLSEIKALRRENEGGLKEVQANLRDWKKELKMLERDHAQPEAFRATSVKRLRQTRNTVRSLERRLASLKKRAA